MGTLRAAWCGLFLVALALGGGGAARGWAAAGGDGTPDSDVADSAGADLSAIREQAQRMPIDRRLDMEKRIRATIDRVNDSVERRSRAALAARLAPGFAMTSDQLLDEKGRLGWTWGDLVIAHTLLANAARKVTLADLESLRSDRLGWAAIAYGLGFHMEDLEDVIKSGGKIASGLAGPAETGTPAAP